jgi:hypothetical protein
MDDYDGLIYEYTDPTDDSRINIYLPDKGRTPKEGEICRCVTSGKLILMRTGFGTSFASSANPLPLMRHQNQNYWFT